MRAVFLLCVFVWSKVEVYGQDINEMKTMPKYDSRYDYLDVEDIFESKRLVRNYVDCLINVKPCTPEGKTLRKLLPEALRTKCMRCTERQKKIAVMVIKRLKNEYPEEWAKLGSRWDPTGDFTRYFEVYLAKEEFNTIPDSGNNEKTPPTPAPTKTPVETISASSSALPSIDNRFGEETDEEVITPRPFTTMRPLISTLNWISIPQTRPTLVIWTPVVPTNIHPIISTYSPYSTAASFIDQIGFKIIRTTELVTDILKNTVKAVVGR